MPLTSESNKDLTTMDRRRVEGRTDITAALRVVCKGRNAFSQLSVKRVFWTGLTRRRRRGWWSAVKFLEKDIESRSPGKLHGQTTWVNISTNDVKISREHKLTAIIGLRNPKFQEALARLIELVKISWALIKLNWCAFSSPCRTAMAWKLIKAASRRVMPT